MSAAITEYKKAHKLYKNTVFETFTEALAKKIEELDKEYLEAV